MAEYVLPLPNPPIPYFDFGITLEQTAYIIAFQWNTRDNDENGSWYFSVYDVNSNPIRTGIKVVLGTYLGRGCKHPLFTRGVFVAVDQSPANKDAGFDDFGTRVVMKYIPVLDIVTRAEGITP